MFRGPDNSGLNAIVLKCKNGETISSSQAPWGKWSEWSHECSQGFRGAMVNMAPNQGVSFIKNHRF